MDLKQQLEKISGSEIPSEDLRESIIKYNKFKKRLLEINNLYMKGSKKLKIIQKALLFGPDFFQDLEQIIIEYKEKSPINQINSKDLVLTGCSIFINDYLIDLIEEAGGNVVFLDTWIGNHYSSQIIDDKLIDAKNDPLNLIIKRFHDNIYGDHFVPNYLEFKISQIEKIYHDYKQKTGKKLGVINHIIKFCDHISIMSAHLKNQLQEKGIRVLNLERDYSRANRGQLSTRIEAFMEML